MPGNHVINNAYTIVISIKSADNFLENIPAYS